MIAFVFAGILVCGFFGMLWWHTTQANLYTTRAGEWRRIQLVDRSTIKLNGQSAVRVHYTRHARDIELIRGEALFSAAHESRRPFRVRSGQSVIQAIGTEFIVRESKSDLDVLVTAGRVTFSVRTDGVQQAAPIIVNAGQGASWATNRGSLDVRVRTLSAEEKRNALLSGGLLELKGEPLRDIATRLHEAGSARIVIGDERAGNLRLGGELRVERADDFVQVLRYFPQLMVCGPDDSGAYQVSSADAPELGPAQCAAPIGGIR